MTMSVNPMLLELDGVSKHYGGVAAVDLCSFSVAERSITGLIGPNGSGKTTVFNLISGFSKPDSGQIRFDGKVLNGMAPGSIYRKGVSRTFQMARIFPRLTALENLMVPVRRKGLQGLIWGYKGVGEVEAAREMLHKLGASHVADELVGRLSYGQRRLVELGTLMMSHPRMVLLDEPAAGVHHSVLETLSRYILDAQGDGVTFVIVEHNLNFVMDICHHVVVLDRGRTIAEGAPDDIVDDQVVLDAYLGD
jgi:ABC-type branched-subunit amino acid transport system ATPase component